MTRARVLQEVRQMRFEELYERRQQRSLTMAPCVRQGDGEERHENVLRRYNIVPLVHPKFR